MIRPRLESSVYLMSYSNYVVKMYVFALGKEHFFASEYKNNYSSVYIGIPNPVTYDSRNQWWFKSLKDVKKYLESEGKKIRLKKYSGENYWEIEYEEE